MKGIGQRLLGRYVLGIGVPVAVLVGNCVQGTKLSFVGTVTGSWYSATQIGSSSLLSVSV